MNLVKRNRLRKSGKHAGKKYTVCVSIYDFILECGNPHQIKENPCYALYAAHLF
jgi:hypothetical protein